MTETEAEQLARHDRAVAVIVNAIGKLAMRPDCPVEAVIEGGLKAAVTLLLASGSSPGEAARVLSDFAEAVGAAARPGGGVVLNFPPLAGTGGGYRARHSQDLEKNDGKTDG